MDSGVPAVMISSSLSRGVVVRVENRLIVVIVGDECCGLETLNAACPLLRLRAKGREDAVH